MRNLHNIEPSAFHRGQYVGYANGVVYRIQRNGRQWKAIPKPYLSRSFSAATLAELSAMLTHA